MSPKEIEVQINKVCWGGRFAVVKNAIKKPLIVIIKSLNLKDRNFVDFIYEEALNEAKAQGILTKFELFHQLKIKGIWSEDDEKSLIVAKCKVLAIKNELEKMVGGRKHRMTERLLNSYTKTFYEYNSRKSSYFSVCAEEYALDIKNSAVVFCSTFDESENKYWKSYSDFQNETDSKLIKNIIFEINKFTPIDTKSMREIARSSQWRFRWNAGKTQGNLFKGNILELDAEQQSLIYWSQIYDSVYDAYERPPDDVIANDEKLDEWFENERRKQKVKDIESGESISGIQLSSEVARHGEIFIVANPAMSYNPPSTQEIEALNTSFVRKFKNKEQEIIKERKLVNEKDLRGRDNRIARKVIGSSESVIGAGNSSLAGRSRGGKGSKDVRPGGSVGAAGIKYGG